MRYVLLLLFFLFLIGCGKPKTVLICGDHICVNKEEADQFFKENLSIEVKIVDQKINRTVDLVKLNLDNSLKSNKKISIQKKNTTDQKVKILSKKEIKKIKQLVNKKKKNIKVAKKNSNRTNDRNLKKLKVKKKSQKKENINTRRLDAYKHRGEIIDVCTIIEKCSIHEISKFLLIQGKNKKFPDITIRE